MKTFCVIFAITRLLQSVLKEKDSYPRLFQLTTWSVGFTLLTRNTPLRHIVN